MRIQHNIMAMNAYNQYNKNTKSLAGNLEKLSSGYKINRAGDDAAGLAISEKMRAQITGLDAAQKNVKDGISLVKTAEGAMQEIHDMLNKMDYLATQSANGTYQDEVDRENLQKEIESLKTEINRIADSSNFNGIKLLDGSLEAKETEATPDVSDATEVQDIGVEAVTGATVTMTDATGPAYNTGDLADRGANQFHAVRITFTNKDGVEKTLTLASKEAITATATVNGGGKDLADLINDGTLTVSTTDTNAKDTLKEFMDTFKVGTGATNKQMAISAKDPESGAKVTKVEYKGDTALKGALDGLAVIGGQKDAAGPQAEVTITANTAGAASSITVGGTTYTSSDTANAGTSLADRAKDLMAQLKDDGYEVEFDGTSKLTIKNLEEAQKGVQIGNTTTDKWSVQGDASTKGKAVFKVDANLVGTGAAAIKKDYGYTLNYVNANGEQTSKLLTVNVPSGTFGAPTLGDALVSAIKGDSELNELFKVTSDGAGTVTIESRSRGTESGYVTGISSDDFKVANDQVKITKPNDTGKILKMADGETIKKGDKLVVDGKTYQFVADKSASVEDGVEKVALGDDDKETWQNLQKALEKNGVNSEVYYERETTAGSMVAKGLRFADTSTDTKTETVKSGGLSLQIGDTADKFNQMTVSIGDMHTKAMGTGKTTLDGKEVNVTKTIADIDIGTQAGAQEAVAVIKNAINYVSSVRGDLGAIQNRLDHTANNLAVMQENIQDAESTIRDTDVANEMMSYVKNNILVQSAQAMLAQANQVPQGVLQLLG